MERETRERIEELAEAVRLEQRFSRPVDMDVLVHHLGGELLAVDNPLLLSGRIRRLNGQQNRKFQIVINEKASERKKRFAIAHTLGHLLIHTKYMSDPKLWEEGEPEYSCLQFGSPNREDEADEFAAALLMPERELCNYVDAVEGRGVNLLEVARYFGVPVTAAHRRCFSLGLVERQ